MALDAGDRQKWRAARVALGFLRFDWSEERIALLERRWAEGSSASSIAKELGPHVSRCAVLGKIHRLKLPQPEFKRRHPRKETASLKRPRVRRAAGGRGGAGVRGPSELMAAFYALGLDVALGDNRAEPSTGITRADAGKAFGPACTLLELTAATCRWPVGDPDQPDFAFCSAAPFKRYPYCLGHCVIAYRPESGESGTQRQAARSRPDRGIEHAA